MNPPLRVDPEPGGTYTIYLLDPADPRQAVYHLTGIHPELTSGNESEIRWAAKQCRLVSERALLNDIRKALRGQSRPIRGRNDAPPEPPPATGRNFKRPD